MRKFGKNVTRTAGVFACLLVLWGQSSLAPLAADQPRGKSGTSNSLVGTWRLVSGTYGGQQSSLPEAAATLKHMTPTHYTWVTYDQNGEVTRIGGGPYVFNGNVLETTLEYGVGSDIKARRGKPQTYQCRVEGKKLYQTGTLATGLTVEEVWELVDK